MYEQETRFGTSSMMTFVQTTILYMSEMCKIKKRMMKDAQYYDERERERVVVVVVVESVPERERD